jgi:hypothetical protein
MNLGYLISSSFFCKKWTYLEISNRHSLPRNNNIKDQQFHKNQTNARNQRDQNKQSNLDRE